MATIVNGKEIAQSIYQRLTKKVAILKQKSITPKLGVILVGGDLPSQTYVKKKGQAAGNLNIGFLLKRCPASISTQGLIKEIEKLQQKKYKLTGLIVQLPLPKKINAGKALEAINSKIDVDCLTQVNLGKLITGSYKIEPPTPGAILEILKYHKIELIGKLVALVGTGHLIGRPLANLLINQRATVTTCNSKTPDLGKITRAADIVITGVGKHNLITRKMIKKGAVVVDAGVCFVDGKMYGDIDFNSVKKKAKLVTPTPGGVGPLTVAKLIENTVKCAEDK
jgi:methylenetetrahydrofolate dehydrogenase (NADP+)/methenyltetrahydrofolate cyclohydrolase